MRTVTVALASALVLGISGMLFSCGGGGKSGESALAETGEAEVTAEERPFYDAGKPFFEAVARRDYEAAYAMLSSHARTRFSKNQITLPDDMAEVNRNDAAAVPITAADLALKMAQVEKEYGKPAELQSYHVYTIEKAVLTKTKKEELGELDSAFALGTMPDSTPMDIRRASLKGQIRVELTEERLAQIAKDEGIKLEDLKENMSVEGGPYFNLKAVLVEEHGELKVGYFEVRPPSMLD
ncbi:MAG: hypothetical protein KIS92_00445 [Planctomycetota bacterium]|nr:hypothetical protein [Planctomycetota bacterium]